MLHPSVLSWGTATVVGPEDGQKQPNSLPAGPFCVICWLQAVDARSEARGRQAAKKWKNRNN
jgi:hypothetical protein